MADLVTPRINANLRQQFLDSGHATVRIVGKCNKVNGDKAVVDANGEVDVELEPSTNMVVGNYYEFVGRIQNDLSIRMLSVCDFGTNIDMKNLERLVAAQHKYKEIFYD